LILAGGAIGSFMTLPGQTNDVALFFDPIAGDLALSRSQVALAYTIGTLTGALPAPLVGRWIDRRGPRLAAAAIAIAMGLACVVMALTWSRCHPSPCSSLRWWLSATIPAKSALRVKAIAEQIRRPPDT
jgi:MFS family permease